ncbi:MAG: hypothetical protein U9R54_01145 [Bacteroidota bacterium]|nr:hypothetical protein [Bacteroidota bacterium]
MRSQIKKIKIIIILLICSFNLYSALPQVQKSSLSDENKEKLEKVKELNSEAKQLNAKAEEYYKEIETVDPAGEAAFDRKIEKKVNKLKDKAYDKQIDAFELQEEANKYQYEVYKELVLNFLNTLAPNDNTALDIKLFEEQAKEYFYRAEMLRDIAYDNDKDLEKVFKKLSEAQEFEKLGLLKENEAYQVTVSDKEAVSDEVAVIDKPTDDLSEKDDSLNANVYSETESSDTQDLTISEKNITSEIDTEPQFSTKDVQIDEKLLRDYLDYISSQGKTDPVAMIKSLNELNDLNSDSFRKAWYEYLSESDVIPDDVKNNLADSVFFIEEKMLADATEATKETKKTSEIDEEKDVISNEIIEDHKEEVVENPESDEDLLYRIEIATDKQTISQGALRKIYNGEKELNIITEGSWQKYSISAFDTYVDADKFRQEIPVKHAFIVSYRKDKQLQVAEIVEEEQDDVVDNDKKEYTSTSDLVYKVQIAAGKTPIPDRFLSQIYGGSLDVDLIEEDGWYKYSVGSYKEYIPASNSRKNSGVKGAFVVAYKNGEKISLDVARGKSVPMYKPADSNVGEFPISNNVIYKVQIAASRKPLSEEIQSEIYSGNKKIHVVHEEGWYKYSIGVYNDVSNAIVSKQNTGINGAFVVAYKNGSKINLFNARKKFVPKLIYDWNHPKNEIVFKVQIAASVKKISIDKLKKIYCLNENIYVVKEDVWYKYSIGVYSTFTDASETRKKSCVTGAFVVAYKNGKKLSINQAIGK